MTNDEFTSKTHRKERKGRKDFQILHCVLCGLCDEGPFLQWSQ